MLALSDLKLRFLLPQHYKSWGYRCTPTPRHPTPLHFPFFKEKKLFWKTHQIKHFFVFFRSFNKTLMWNVGHSTAEHHLALIPEHTCIPSVCLAWCVPNDLKQHCFFRSTKRKMEGEWEEVNPKRTKPFLVCAVWDPGHACFGLEGRQKLWFMLRWRDSRLSWLLLEGHLVFANHHNALLFRVSLSLQKGGPTVKSSSCEVSLRSRILQKLQSSLLTSCNK